jgi:hypothetical protein
VFADVMKATDRPTAELAIRITAGDRKNAAAVAAAISDWVDLRDGLYHGPPWVVAAAGQALAAEADLVPDDMVDPIVGRLLDLAAMAATAPLIAGQPSREAFHALAKCAGRIMPHCFDKVAIVRGLYHGVPERRGHLTDLLKAAVGQSNPGHAWETIGILRQPGDALEAIARWRAMLTHSKPWPSGSSTPRSTAAARRSAAVLLRIPVGHQRNSWDFGGSFGALTATKVAVLVGDGDQDDDLPPAELAASPSSAAEDPAHPGDAAVAAAGAVQPLAAAVLDKLLDMAADRYDMAVERVDAVQALDILIPRTARLAYKGDSPAEYWSEDDPGESEPFHLAEVNRKLAALGGRESEMAPARTQTGAQLAALEERRAELLSELGEQGSPRQ